MISYGAIGQLAISGGLRGGAAATYLYCANVVLETADTGLTLSAQLRDSDFVDTGSLITTGFNEFGATGQYGFTLRLPQGFRGYIDVYDGATELVRFAVNPQDAENADAKTSTRESEASAATRHTEVIDDYLNDGVHGLPAIESLVDDLETRVGQNTDAATDPSLGTGTIFSKLRGLGADTDTITAAIAALPPPNGVIKVSVTETPIKVSVQQVTAKVSVTETPVKVSVEQVSVSVEQIETVIKVEG